MKNNIYSIVQADLCVSCGTCSKACNLGAISVSFNKGLFTPSVDETRCSSCGNCLKSCPSYKIDVQKTYGELDFSRKDEECYVAYSKDGVLRHQSTSGGVVSTMVYELLKRGIYEKAYTLDYEFFDGNRAVLHAITNPDDVFKSQKSKYIPASVEEVVEDIDNQGISKSIVVGTPCQILAIKRYLANKKKENEDILFIGLFCDKTLNYNIYRYYDLKYGKSDVFHFRDKDGNGWPGDTMLRVDGKQTIIDKSIRMSLKPYLQLNRCRYCFDKLNQLADISCGDCYIPGQESTEGKSSVVIRTDRGRKAFDLCKENMEWEASSFDAIKKSQALMAKLENMQRNARNGVFVNIPEDCLNRSSVNEVDEEKARKQMALGKKFCSKKDVTAIDKMIEIENAKPKKSKLRRITKRLGKVFYNPDRRIKVLIDNAGFVNKGAELMLCSVVQQLRKRMPNALIVLPKNIFYENPSYCVKNHIVPLQKASGKAKRFAKSFIYRNLLNKPWYVTPDQIDVVLDAGGFQFSDQWKATENDVNKKARYYASFSKKDRKIIFLPQAFGPFKEESSQRMMKNVYGFADVIYAREKVSYDYLKELFPDDKKIKQCPDFTCLSKCDKRKTVVLPENYVLIVPNARMITHTEQKVSSDYLAFLKEIIVFITELGERVVLLNHEGADDEELLDEINRELPQQLLLLSNLDALEVKHIIAGSKLLVSSRFHGVVSGLTQGVPTLCTSWSHKYFELLKDHKCESNVLDVNDIEGAKSIIQQALAHPAEYTSKEGCVSEIKKQAEKMWNEVFKLIHK